MRGLGKHFIPVLIGAAGIAAGQPSAFTAEQAAAGRATYEANCAICHVADLGGRNEAPQLAGSNFISQWGDKTSNDLIAFMRATMPPGNAGGLGDQAYINLAAFILEANGARPGIDTSVPIRSAATAALRQAGAGLPVAPAKPPPPATPRGITVAGEVKNYVPVTDAMLRNPDPADWLMIRRDYKASNSSSPFLNHRFFDERKILHDDSTTDAGLSLDRLAASAPTHTAQ